MRSLLGLETVEHIYCVKWDVVEPKLRRKFNGSKTDLVFGVNKQGLSLVAAPDIRLEDLG
jgi:hypothetical protein